MNERDDVYEPGDIIYYVQNNNFMYLVLTQHAIETDVFVIKIGKSEFYTYSFKPGDVIRQLPTSKLHRFWKKL